MATAVESEYHECVTAGNPPQRLESWGEIAGYLGVSVRTAQKWEAESGLPVRRLGSGPRPRVFAETTKLDEWLLSHTTDAPVTSARQGKRGLLLKSLAAAAVITGAAVLGMLIGPFTESRQPVTWEVLSHVLRVQDSRGQVIWSRVFPDLRHDRYHQPLTSDSWDCVVFTDVDGDENLEVLFNWAPEDANSRPGKLYCLDGQSGETRWELGYGKKLRLPKEEFTPAFSGRRLVPVRLGDKLHLIAVAVHQPWNPCRVLLIDAAEGRLVSEFNHPGWLPTIALFDIDGDGSPELFLGGGRNPDQIDWHATLVVLDLPFPTATAGPWIDEFGNPSPRPLSTLVFPKTDIYETGEGYRVVDMSPGSAGTLNVAVSAPALYYRVDFSSAVRPRLLSVRPTSQYLAEHRRLYKEGALDHEELSDEDLEEMKKVQTLEEFLDAGGDEGDVFRGGQEN